MYKNYKTTSKTYFIFNQMKKLIFKRPVNYLIKNVETAPTVGFEPRLLHFRENATSTDIILIIDIEVTVRLSYHTLMSS